MLSDTVTDISYGIAIAVIAVTLIYRVCELMIEALQELDEQEDDEDD